MLVALTLTFWNSDTDSSTEAAALEGAGLFEAKGCASCHDGPSSTARPGGAPSLRRAVDWAGDRRPGMTAEEYIAESIVAPAVFVSPAYAGGVPWMPTLTVTQDEIDALVTYLLDHVG
ncbi:c-type cytochrome [Ilumatobacter fluminis]|uniref:c-type cytochrome n=1 Tax=Ilumatobacter fluminis TaxID=467091 RepID=UPI001414E22D|nr:cytochrome c [Ilumatobacter fluminis]